MSSLSLQGLSRGLGRLFALPGATTLLLASLVGAEAADDSAFHEVETKYIFGNFTIGSATGIEGEKAFELETPASFGKRFGQYATGQTTLEFEYTPTQFMQIELGPTVSAYNIRNVPGLNDLNMVSVNGFEGDFRFLLFERGPSSPFAVTLSVEPEFHSLDETSGARVTNYGLETRLEADADLAAGDLGFPGRTHQHLGGDLPVKCRTEIDCIARKGVESHPFIVAQIPKVDADDHIGNDLEGQRR